MCLDRSRPVPLEVTVAVCDGGRLHASCTCNKDKRERLVPNEIDPCEWHFAFESLVEAGRSKRIRTLNILFNNRYTPIERALLGLGNCRFFDLSSFQFTTLEWTDRSTSYANNLFSVPPFPPTLRSLSFKGSRHVQFMQLNNLTSFAFDNHYGKISAETFRTFMLNNRFLETLSLGWTMLYGSPDGPPVDLSNLKSFSIGYAPLSEALSTLVRVPALHRLSSLRISPTQVDYRVKFCATGDGIVFTLGSDLPRVANVWKDLTRYAKPTIHHVRLENCSEEFYLPNNAGGTTISLLADAHTLEVGRSYLQTYLDDLKQLGSQLKAIRFEAPEKGWGRYLLDDIEDLVKCRFEQGRPFSLVERMVVSESEQVNRQQADVWRSFYVDCCLDQYVRPE